jgi:hypothetical protein
MILFHPLHSLSLNHYNVAALVVFVIRDAVARSTLTLLVFAHFVCMGAEDTYNSYGASLLPPLFTE